MKPTIQMPHPCHEDWEQMTPEAKGRHCAVCNTKVMDFTHSTHDEVVDYLQKNEDACVKLPAAFLEPEPKQLNAHGAWQSVAMVTLSTLALGAAAPAMAQKFAEPYVIAPTQEAVEIRGVINHNRTPEERLSRAAYVKVSLVGMPYCTKTNTKGEFTLLVDKHLYQVGAQLLLESGFVPAKTVTITQIDQPLLLQIDDNMVHGRSGLRFDGCQNIEPSEEEKIAAAHKGRRNSEVVEIKSDLGDSYSYENPNGVIFRPIYK